MAKPDQNYVLRQLPFAVGGLAGILLLTNRMLTPQLTESQARSDAVGVILSAVLILTGLLWQQVQPRSPDAVDLIGEQGFELLPGLPDEVKTELAWASHLLLTNTVTRSLVVVYQGKVLLRRGVLGVNPEVKPGAILKRVLKNKNPSTWLTSKSIQGALNSTTCQKIPRVSSANPLAIKGVFILGANAPRSYTKQDENWIEGIADKLANTLSRFSDDLAAAEI
jgi:hypothetical protein